jgi:hypothetical protein
LQAIGHRDIGDSNQECYETGRALHGPAQ